MIDMRNVTDITIKGTTLWNQTDYEEYIYLKQDPTVRDDDIYYTAYCRGFGWIPANARIEIIASDLVPTSSTTFVNNSFFWLNYNDLDVIVGLTETGVGLRTVYENETPHDLTFSNTISSNKKYKFIITNGHFTVINLTDNTTVVNQSSEYIIISPEESSSSSFTINREAPYGRATVWSVKIYTENGMLEHEMLPAKRKSDNVLGFYDNLHNNFFAGLNGQGQTSPSYYIAGPVPEDKHVVKIEDYYNGQLRQIWPCWTPGPSNPTAPVVSNAFDYDDNITWTVGTGVENTDEYYYYPITATGQANGIQIAVADNPNGWNDDGKPTSNTTYTWYVQAERAGYYQMIMSAKMSSAGHATTGYWSYADIQVNGSTSGVQKLTLYGDTPDFDAVDYNDVVVAIVPLTGYEDAVSFKQQSFRILVDPTSNIIFREIAATSPAFLTLDTTNVTTSYTQGDTFSYSGLVVYQTLANGTANTISSGYTVSSPDMSTTGTKTVTVTYGGLTASYDITVSSAGATWVTTSTLTNSDNKTVEQGTCGGYDAVRIGVLDYSTGGFGSDGRVSSTSTDEVYKITPPSAGDYMLVLPIRRGSGDPQFYINGNSIGSVSGTSSSEFLYIEITYPITLTSGENTLTIRNNSYRCYWDTDDYVYLVKSSTNPFS